MANTHFINVDLEIRAATDLKELVKAFEPSAMVLSCMALENGFLANLELSRQPTDADRAIVSFLRLVDTLSPDDRRQWDRATRRDFSIGVQSGATPSFELAIAPTTLAGVAAVGARITFVVYPPELLNPSDH